MSGNTSVTGGYLTPSNPQVDDATLDNIIQAFIVGVTGMVNTNVRPRWQKEPPNMPDFTVDWCSFGIQTRKGDTFPVDWHTPNLHNAVIKNQTLEVLVSFYGPNSELNADTLRDGIMVPQNRDTLDQNGLKIASVGDVIAVPNLLNVQWQYRCDLPITFRRATLRTYDVLDIATAHGTIVTDTPLTEPFSN